MLLTRIMRLLIASTAITAAHTAYAATDDVGNTYAIVGDNLVVTNGGQTVLTHPAVAFHAVRPLGGCIIEQVDGDLDLCWPEATWPHSSWGADYIDSNNPGEWYQIPNHPLADDNLAWAQYEVTDTGWIIRPDVSDATIPINNTTTPPLTATIKWSAGVHWAPPRFLGYSYHPPTVTSGAKTLGYIAVPTIIFIREFSNGAHLLGGTLEYNTFDTPTTIPVFVGGQPTGITCDATTRILAVNDMACALVDFGAYSVWLDGRVLEKSVVWIPSDGAMVDDFHYEPYARQQFPLFFHEFYAPDGARASIIGISPPTDQGADTRLVCTTDDGRMFWTTPESKDVPGGHWFDGEPAEFIRVLANKRGLVCVNPSRIEPAPWCGGIADINMDYQINTADLSLLILSIGATDPACDLNSDGVVDTSDLAILIGEMN